MKCYTLSQTFDEVYPIYLTMEEYQSMKDDGYAVFLTEQEAEEQKII